MLKRDPSCTRCSLHKTAEFVCLLGVGPAPSEVMFVGEAPGHREDTSGTPFVGRAGQLLDDMLTNVGFNRKKVFITNAVSCRPPDNRTPRKSEIKACRFWLDYQIKNVKPKYVALLGNVALESMLGLKGIRKLRGRPIQQDGVIYLPMYHPSYILRGDYKDQPIAEQDLRYFKEIIEFGGIPEERALNYTIVNSWKQVDKMIEALTGAVSIDIETTGLYPWATNAEIVVLGFGTATGEFTLPISHKESSWTHADITKILKRISSRLKDCYTILHNGKFDLLWLRVMYEVNWHMDFDTMLAHHAVDENSQHALDVLAQVFLRAPNWDIPLEEKQGNAPIEKIAKYHAHDVYYTRRLYFILREKLAEDEQVKRVFTKLIMPCANLFVEMEERGLFLDRQKMAQAEKYLKSEMASALERLNKWGEINWSSPQQVANLLYGKLKIKCALKTKKGSNSSSESALKMIQHPCVTDLLKYRGHKQQLSFFINGWLPYLDSSFLHPSFKLHGTVTGRLSSEHPNCQQIPRDTLIRSLITAPKGWTLVESDLSQVELRIVAELSRDSAMMEAFRDKRDIHWLTALRELERGIGKKELVLDTAEAITGKKLKYGEALEALLEAGPDAAQDFSKDWKELRKKAKAINFGYVYGMGWRKFQAYARDNYDMDLDDRESQLSRVNFFQLYRSLPGWHERQRSFARANGYVRSLAGRKRRLPLAQQPDAEEFMVAEALRQAINSPVQSFASDINLMVLLQLRQEFSRNIVQPVATIHDSILMHVRNEHVVEVSERVLAITRRPALFDAFNIKLTVPIEGEVKVGAWGLGVSLERWKAEMPVLQRSRLLTTSR